MEVLRGVDLPEIAVARQTLVVASPTDPSFAAHHKHLGRIDNVMERAETERSTLGGIDLDSEQATKTRTAPEFFSRPTS